VRHDAIRRLDLFNVEAEGVSALMIAAPAAGWYPDPILQAPLRWWDGAG
jgi:hypothetical protein